MRTPFATLATALSLALPTAFASFTPALATQVATKPAEVVTIGSTGRPDAQPADPRAPMATRASSLHGATAPALQTVTAKPRDTSTSLAPDAVSLTAAQRSKLAQRPEPVTPPASGTSANAKSGNLSTVEPPATGATAMSPAALAQLKSATAPAAAPVQAAHARGSASVLGMIPRPEWSAGITTGKPADVSTGATPAPGVSRATVAAPSTTELHGRAATTSASHEPKAHETSTALPRDPALPPAGATKPSASSNTNQEVQQ